jgi:hypothetical protein
VADQSNKPDEEPGVGAAAYALTWNVFYTPPMPDPSGLSVTESLTGHHHRMFYERHRSLALLMVLILFLAPFAGLSVTGLLGSVVGVVLPVAAYYLIPPLWRMFGR